MAAMNSQRGTGEELHPPKSPLKGGLCAHVDGNWASKGGFRCVGVSSAMGCRLEGGGTDLHPPKSSKKAGPCSGFALVELIAALFVLSAGVFGAITLYDTGMERMRAQQEELMAMSVLQYAMEPVQAMDAMGLDTWSNTETAPPGMQHLEDAGMERLVSARTEGLFEVQAILRWRGAGGRVMERSLTTLVYAGEHGP